MSNKRVKRILYRYTRYACTCVVCYELYETVVKILYCIGGHVNSRKKVTLSSNSLMMERCAKIGECVHGASYDIPSSRVQAPYM